MSPTTSPGRRIWRTALHLKIEIKPDNRVYAEGPRQDIGQGFLTTFAMQVADHLDVPIENMDVISVKFWTWETRGPVALVVVAVYFLGMLSGWTVVAFVQRSIRRLSERPRA